MLTVPGALHLTVRMQVFSFLMAFLPENPLILLSCFCAADFVSDKLFHIWSVLKNFYFAFSPPKPLSPNIEF